MLCAGIGGYRAGLILPVLHSQIVPPAFFKSHDITVTFCGTIMHTVRLFAAVRFRHVCVWLGLWVYWKVNHWPLASDESSHQLGWPVPPHPPPFHFPFILLPSLSHPVLFSATTSPNCELKMFSLSKVASGCSSARLESLPLTESFKKKMLKCWEERIADST